MVVLAAGPQDPVPAGASELHGSVVGIDGQPVGAAAVSLTCASWTRSGTTAPDGTFHFTGVPAGQCRLRALAPGSSGDGIDLPADVSTGAPLRVVLPAPVLAAPSRTPDATPAAEPVSGSLRLDLRHMSSPPAATVIGGIAVSSQWRGGTASGTGSPIQGPPVRPAWQDWSVVVSGRRPGPLGTLFVGSVGARRTPGPVSLLADSTGLALPAGTGSSSLLDPTRTGTIWDARLRLERRFVFPGAEITAFAEAYHSFESSPARTVAPPVSSTNAPGRTGRAFRGGARIRWE